MTYIQILEVLFLGNEVMGTFFLFLSLYFPDAL